MYACVLSCMKYLFFPHFPLDHRRIDFTRQCRWGLFSARNHLPMQIVLRAGDSLEYVSPVPTTEDGLLPELEGPATALGAQRPHVVCTFKKITMMYLTVMSPAAM